MAVLVHRSEDLSGIGGLLFVVSRSAGLKSLRNEDSKPCVSKSSNDEVFDDGAVIRCLLVDFD